MKKYYQMAINLGNPSAMRGLAYYYINIENNYNETIKYVIMLLELDNKESLNLFEEIKNNINLIEFYNQVNCIKEKNENINIIIKKLLENREVYVYVNKK